MSLSIRTSLSNLTSVDRHAREYAKSSSNRRLSTKKTPLYSEVSTKAAPGKNNIECIQMLLCLDHLRSLRRSQSLQIQDKSKNFLTIAIWALNQSIIHETKSGEGTDPYFDTNNHHEDEEDNLVFGRGIKIPSLQTMESEFLYKITSRASDESPYEYDDQHPTNQMRLYKHQGLGNEPISLQDLIRLASQNPEWDMMTREQGEEIMQKDPMFLNFVEAVKAKGFFRISDDELVKRAKGGEKAITSRQKLEMAKEEVYQEKYRKVIDKFRTKLVENGFEDYGKKEEDKENRGNYPVKETRTVQPREDYYDDEATVTGSVVGDMIKARDNGTLHFDDIDDDRSVSSRRSSTRRMTMSMKVSRKDIEEAEALKNKGNTCMQEKKYAQARDYYTEALEVAPSGPTSHVYYSNRAAALLSMRNFTEAVWDAERSINLKPEYAKAHARLGLAKFLLGHYESAVKVYTKAVQLEPNNKSSIQYLEKSKKKLSTSNTFPKNEIDDDVSSVSSRTRLRSDRRKSVLRSKLPKSKSESTDEGDEDPTMNQTSSDKLKEANQLKVEGNKAMARKKYSEAISFYSKALRLAPAGPQSHVFFSNRAAAYCYLEKYEEAELDAERALALNPEFGKAHARLGLSRYFLKDYTGALEAYESALMYDPDNESSKIYLAKAKLKLGRRSSVVPE